MTLRTKHGRAAQFSDGPTIETLPFDELPPGVQAIELVEAGGERTPDGRFAKGASTAQSKGGKALKNRTELSHKLPPDLANDPGFEAYRSHAKAFAKHHLGELAVLVGGGEVPTGPASMVMSAALQLAASRYLFAKGDFKTASTLANDSRSSLAMAHEYTAKLAKAKPKLSAIERLRSGGK